MGKKENRLVEYGLMVFVVLLGAAIISVAVFWPSGEQRVQGQSDHRTLPLAAAPTGGDFQLSREGESFDLADYRGKVVLLYFGYTFCPDVCPTSLALMRQAFRQLDAGQLEQVQGVFVSVDPERDTPERLSEYTDFFHPRILGVSGTNEQLDAVGKLYGAAWQRAESDSAMGYAVDHSSNTYVIDRDGRLVEILPHGADAERILSSISPLITEE
jgi:protein SCO1